MARSSFSDPHRSDFLSSGPRASKSRNTNKRKRRARGSDRGRGAASLAGPVVYTLAVIAGIALIVVVIALVIGARNDDVDPTHKVLELTAQDIDPETTAAEKNLLKVDQIDSRLAAALSRDARRQLSGSALQEAQRALSGWPRMNPKRATPSIFTSMAFRLANSRSNRTVTRSPWLAEPDNRSDCRSPAPPTQTGQPFSGQKPRRAMQRLGICKWGGTTNGSWS